jgi:hypothetical protein
MLFRTGIENNNDGRSIAWALEHPGCYAYGKHEKEASANLPKATRSYGTWIGKHDSSWIETDEIEVRVEETWEVYFVNDALEVVPEGGHSVESFFKFEWKPLTEIEIERARKMLAWSREDLLDAVKGLQAEKLGRTYPNERWSINGILKHVGGAEWWYLERIGFPYPEKEDDVPEKPFERLEIVRANLNAILPQLAGLNRVVGLDGEFWSPRKVLRRALWHERDHTEHILKLLQM